MYELLEAELTANLEQESDRTDEALSYSILVVEDEPSLVETLEYNLKNQGYAVTTETNGRKSVEVARRLKPDLIVLDVMLPDMDGFEICRTLRQEMNTTILMLTARSEEVDKIVGLEVGADDYLTKPFSMRELLARVKAHLRRTRLIRQELIASSVGGSATVNLDVPTTQEKGTGMMVFDDLTINLNRHEVSYLGSSLHLKPMEFELLVYLGRNCGLVLSRDQILAEVWGWDYQGGSRTVDVHVRWLREKIEPNPAKPERIVTVRSVGYRFEG